MRKETGLIGALLLTLAVSASAGPCSGTSAPSGGARPASGSIEGVSISPNPWRSDRHNAQALRFAAAVALDQISVFTASGRWVRTLHCRCGEPFADWDLRNDAGQSVKSGIYVYLMRDVYGRQRRGSVAVVR
ncbi:MAG: hypothetical protein HY554_18870 [Elusimicrobia bacterium]|nr:hypothetical protein [Elusimicrobiota bacterium]